MHHIRNLRLQEGNCYNQNRETIRPIKLTGASPNDDDDDDDDDDEYDYDYDDFGQCGSNGGDHDVCAAVWRGGGDHGQIQTLAGPDRHLADDHAGSDYVSFPPFRRSGN